jgi:DNA-binding NtrC family response regulator
MDRPREGRLGNTFSLFEKQRLIALLESYNWSVTKAALAAQIDERQIRRRMKLHGVTRPPKPRAKHRLSPQFRRVGKRAWEPVPT